MDSPVEPQHTSAKSSDAPSTFIRLSLNPFGIRLSVLAVSLACLFSVVGFVTVYLIFVGATADPSALPWRAATMACAARGLTETSGPIWLSYTARTSLILGQSNRLLADPL